MRPECSRPPPALTRHVLTDKAEKLAEAPPAPGSGRAPKIVKEGLSEYFIFTVEGKQTVKNGWSQRIVSFRARQVPFKVLYRYRRHQVGARPVRFFILANDTEHKLGESPLLRRRRK